MDKDSKNWSDKLRDLFSSMKFGLALLGIIAFSAGIGTLFPQATENPAGAKAVSKIWVNLGFTHLYSTFWFRLLLGLLCLNLIVCSIQRAQGIYTRTFALKNHLSKEGRNVSGVQTEITGGFLILRQATQSVLREKGYRLVSQEFDGIWSFKGIKHRLGNWGSFVTHISFVILILGALLSSTGGFKGYFIAGEGDIVPLQTIKVTKGKINQNFSMQINSAEKRFLANGELDNWYTNLSILKNDKEVARQTLSVNHPFTYEGVTFYQTDFANGVHLTADKDRKKIPFSLQDGAANYFQAPNTDLYLVVAGMKNYPKHPSILYVVFKGKDVKPVQQGELSAGQTVNIQENLKVTLDKYVAYTGLQVKKDPGVWVVWFGSIFLMIGLLLSFYWRSSVVTGVLETVEGNQGKLTLGLSDGKHFSRSQESLDKLVDKLTSREKGIL